jgi:multimeric flavodoxin WrbA
MLMKTITAFVGSARKKGLTYAATRQFLNNLQSCGEFEGEVVFLSDYNLRACRGCKSCFAKGEECCPLKDDRDVLIAKMMNSDGVVFASPNYSFQVSAIMKTFLDRLGFAFHRPCFHGKTFTSIVAQGIHGGGKIVKYLDFVGGGLGFNVVGGSCITAFEPMGEKERGKMRQALASHSSRFYRQLLKPARPAPSLFQLMVFRMGRTSIKRMLGAESRDYTYYRDRGWFESDYFYPSRLNPLKRAAGASFDWLASRMFKQGDA